MWGHFRQYIFLIYGKGNSYYKVGIVSTHNTSITELLSDLILIKYWQLAMILIFISILPCSIAQPLTFLRHLHNNVSGKQ